MTLASEKTIEHIGETRASSDSVHDLVQTLTRCLNGVWRYDQYIANAEDNMELQRFWRNFREQERTAINRMKEFLIKELSKDKK